MNQMQSFIEKAKNDKELMAKLDTLGASGAETDKIIALAADYGFNVTAEDYRQAVEQAGPHKKGELAEEDLEAAAGGAGGATENRYNPEVCSKYTMVHYNCVGLLTMTCCDHYRMVYLGASHPDNRHTCQMGVFDYHFSI